MEITTTISTTSFRLHFRWRKYFDKLSDSDRGRLLSALFDYCEFGIIPIFSGGMEMLFSIVRDEIDSESEKAVMKSEQMRINGSKGGRPKSPTYINIVMKNDEKF